MRWSRLLILLTGFAIFTPCHGGSPNVPSAKIGDTVTTVQSDKPAQLCPSPNCAGRDVITTIPPGASLRVEGIVKYPMPRWKVVWYKVSYQGREGWINEYRTDRAPAHPRR